MLGLFLLVTPELIALVFLALISITFIIIAIIAATVVLILGVVFLPFSFVHKCLVSLNKHRIQVTMVMRLNLALESESVETSGW
jgi:hypothetical protein